MPPKRPAPTSQRSRNNDPQSTWRGVIFGSALFIFIHFSLYHAVAIGRIALGVSQEFRSLKLAGIERPSKSTAKQSIWERAQDSPEVTGAITTTINAAALLLSLPVLAFHPHGSPSKSHFRELELPLWGRIANSCLAGSLLFFVIGHLVTLMTAKGNAWRNFFTGESETARGSLPAAVEEIPIVKALRFAQDGEQSELKRLITFAVVHAILTQGIRTGRMAEGMNGTSGPWTLAYHLVSFPAEPFLVADMHQFMLRAAPQSATIVWWGNSVVVAVIVMIVVKWCAKRGEVR